tara:strand:- start:149 stop:328 length:180 start_codon:yes stop_codon:yes gene_type:complete
MKKMRTKQKHLKIISEVCSMLAKIRTVFSKQKEAILLDMIGCVSLFIIFATALHIPILI